MTCSTRHWFTRRGLVGIPTRVCVRPGCDAENPYLADRLDAIGWDLNELDLSETK